MKTFQRYLSSINKGSIVEVLDLPAAVLDHLLAKIFQISENDYEPATLSGLQRSIQRLLSEGSSPFTVLSPFKRQLVRWHQSSTAVNINKFSCCNTSQFSKHLQGPSDLNDRAVFFPVWTFAASLSTDSRSLTGQ